MSANITQTLRFVRQSSEAKAMDFSMSGKEVTSILYEHENSTDVDRDEGDNEADELLQVIKFEWNLRKNSLKKSLSKFIGKIKTIARI